MSTLNAATPRVAEGQTKRTCRRRGREVTRTICSIVWVEDHAATARGAGAGWVGAVKQAARGKGGGEEWLLYGSLDSRQRCVPCSRIGRQGGGGCVPCSKGGGVGAATGVGGWYRRSRVGERGDLCRWQSPRGRARCAGGGRRSRNEPDVAAPVAGRHRQSCTPPGKEFSEGLELKCSFARKALRSTDRDALPYSL